MRRRRGDGVFDDDHAESGSPQAQRGLRDAYVRLQSDKNERVDVVGRGKRIDGFPDVGLPVQVPDELVPYFFPAEWQQLAERRVQGRVRATFGVVLRRREDRHVHRVGDLHQVGDALDQALSLIERELVEKFCCTSITTSAVRFASISSQRRRSGWHSGTESAVAHPSRRIPSSALTRRAWCIVDATC